ncbi:nucleotidyltransferase family protein, partial [Hydrogenophaga sp.]|uniref:nucleotidyltransferase domain-containing protein n=1 Tax=Hydrogenophaga sp. TaxID=1904254 RepID=UPI0025B949F7
MHPSLHLLTQSLFDHRAAAQLSPGQWDLVIRLARRADVLGRMASTIGRHGAMAKLPVEVTRHLRSSMLLADRQHEEIRHEVRRLQGLFAPMQLPLILLKGAAYVIGELDAGHGRMVSDIDILVPRDRLADAESALMRAGWVSTKSDAYDQHYYRTWMHELPPLRHMRRGTVLDVHHALVPLTGSLASGSDAILAAAVPVPGWANVRTLAPADMVLHSAAHLFTEGE